MHDRKFGQGRYLGGTIEEELEKLQGEVKLLQQERDVLSKPWRSAAGADMKVGITAKLANRHPARLSVRSYRSRAAAIIVE